MAFSNLRGFSTKLFFSVLLLTFSSVDAQANIDKRATGALTPLSSKSKVCSVLDYGGVADGKTDIGPAITKAFSSCVSGNAATLYIPEGQYSRTTSDLSTG